MGAGSSLLAHIGSWWMGAVSDDPQDGQTGSSLSTNDCSSMRVLVASAGGMRVDQVADFVRAREAMGLVLGEDELIVHLDVEDPAVPLLELRVDAVALLQLSRQTGGRGQVVSLGAVGDPDVHGGLLCEGYPGLYAPRAVPATRGGVRA